jgi:peptide/nickel transport system permease protein
MGALGLTLVLAIVLGALFADVLTSYEPSRLATQERFLSPSPSHLLGTDHLGRDLFTRVLHGARVALAVALVATSLSFAGGLTLGMAAGYGPRWLDSLLLLLFDALRSFPTVMLALALVTLIGPSLPAVVLVVIVATLPGYGRVVRAQTMSLKAAEFVLAARAIGTPAWRALALHVMPNLIGPMLIIVSMDIPVVITIEAGMSFLGLGVRPPTPSWGSILNDGFFLHPRKPVAGHRRRPSHHHRDAGVHLPRRDAARPFRPAPAQGRLSAGRRRPANRAAFR